MKWLKHYDFEKFGEKFKRYRMLYLAGIAVFFLSAASEMVLIGSAGFTADAAAGIFRDRFMSVFLWEEIGYGMVFLLGITVYAPFIQYGAMLFRGVVSGFLLSVSFGSVKGTESLILFFILALYLIGSSHLFCGYASFCTCVCLRLFTDQSLKRYRTKESDLFGGTLFCSDFFCNTVNLRFLFTYSLIFFAVSGVNVLFCLIYAVSRGFGS